MAVAVVVVVFTPRHDVLRLAPDSTAAARARVIGSRLAAVVSLRDPSGGGADGRGRARRA
jgi:hypothetical protein